MRSATRKKARRKQARSDNRQGSPGGTGVEPSAVEVSPERAPRLASPMRGRASAARGSRSAKAGPEKQQTPRSNRPTQQAGNFAIGVPSDRQPQTLVMAPGPTARMRDGKQEVQRLMPCNAMAARRRRRFLLVPWRNGHACLHRVCAPSALWYPRGPAAPKAGPARRSSNKIQQQDPPTSKPRNSAR